MLALCGAARADPGGVAELGYERPADLDECPDEAALRLAVVERLRRDPFVRGAQRKIQVRITRSGPSLVAIVSVDEAGVDRGQRRIETRAGCAELGSAAALAVSIAVDPVAALADPGEGEVAKPAPPPAPQTKPEPARPPPLRLTLSRQARDAGFAPFVRVGARAWIGAVPSLGAGPSLGFGFRLGRWSAALDAVAVLPETQRVDGTSREIAVGLLGAQLSPCVHLAGFRSCALLTSGVLFAQGRGVAKPRSERAWYATAGVGIGYSFSAGRVSLTPLVEAGLRLETAQLSIADQLAWSTPRALAALGVEVGYTLGR